MGNVSDIDVLFKSLSWEQDLSEVEKNKKWKIQELTQEMYKELKQTNYNKLLANLYPAIISDRAYTSNDPVSIEEFQSKACHLCFEMVKNLMKQQQPTTISQKLFIIGTQAVKYTIQEARQKKKKSYSGIAKANQYPRVLSNLFIKLVNHIKNHYPTHQKVEIYDIKDKVQEMHRQYEFQFDNLVNMGAVLPFEDKLNISRSVKFFINDLLKQSKHTYAEFDEFLKTHFKQPDFVKVKSQQKIKKPTPFVHFDSYSMDLKSESEISRVLIKWHENIEQIIFQPSKFIKRQLKIINQEQLDKWRNQISQEKAWNDMQNLKILKKLSMKTKQASLPATEISNDLSSSFFECSLKSFRTNSENDLQHLKKNSHQHFKTFSKDSDFTQETLGGISDVIRQVKQLGQQKFTSIHPQINQKQAYQQHNLSEAQQSMIIELIKQQTKKYKQQKQKSERFYSQTLCYFINDMSQSSYQAQNNSSKLPQQAAKRAYLVYLIDKLIPFIIQDNLIRAIEQLNRLSYKIKDMLNIQNGLPSLISFKINDLVRCKFEGTQEELLKVYEKMYQLWRENLVEIVQVKNRFEGALRDAVIYIKLPHSPLVCECQLAVSHVKEILPKNKIIEKLNHSLYEISRNPYGFLAVCSADCLKSNTDSYTGCHKHKFTSNDEKKQVIEKCLKNCNKQFYDLSNMEKPQIRNLSNEGVYYPFLCCHCFKYRGIPTIKQYRYKCSNHEITLCESCLKTYFSEKIHKDTLNKIFNKKGINKSLNQVLNYKNQQKFVHPIFSEKICQSLKCIPRENVKTQKQLFQYLKMEEKKAIQRNWCVYFVRLQTVNPKPLFSLFEYNHKMKTITNAYDRQQVYDMQSKEYLFKNESHFYLIERNVYRQLGYSANYSSGENLCFFLQKTLFLFDLQYESNFVQKLKGIQSNEYFYYLKIGESQQREAMYVPLSFVKTETKPRPMLWFINYLKEQKKEYSYVENLSDLDLMDDQMKMLLNDDMSKKKDPKETSFYKIDFPKLANIKTLILSNNKIKSSLGSIFWVFVNLQNLEIDRNRLTEIVFSHKLQNLKSINCSNNEIEKLERLQNIPRIRKMNLSNNFIRSLVIDVELAQLKEINLCLNPVGEIECNRAPNLQTLFLDRVNFSSELVQAQLVKGNKFQKLEKLSLIGSALTDMPDFSYLPSLKFLDLNWNPTQIPTQQSLIVVQSLMYKPNFSQLKFHLQSENIYQELEVSKSMAELVCNYPRKKLDFEFHQPIDQSDIGQQCSRLSKLSSIRWKGSQISDQSFFNISFQQTKPLSSSSSSSQPHPTLSTNHPLVTPYLTQNTRHYIYLKHALTTNYSISQRFLLQQSHPKKGQVFSLNHSWVRIQPMFFKLDWRMLCQVDFSCCWINDDGWRDIVKGNQAFVNLKRLIINHNQISTVTVEEVSSFFSIEYIRFFESTSDSIYTGEGGNPFTNDTFSILQHYNSDQRDVPNRRWVIINFATQLEYGQRLSRKSIESKKQNAITGFFSNPFGLFE